MANLSSTSRVRVSPDQVSSELGKEVVILHVKDGMYYGLDEVGVLIWKKLQESVPVSEIVASVVAEFDVDAKQCEQDILVILSDMADKHLIAVEAS